MEFNKLVFDRLKPIFDKHNLYVAEQFENYVKLKSDRVVIVLSHSPRENSNSFEVGRNEKFLYPINDNVIKEVFNGHIRVNNAPSGVFIENLAVFFEAEGRALLNGDISALKAVERYVYKESENYTTQLVDKQNLDAANKAWQEGNYRDFIKYLDKIDKQNLPSSYKLKYKMAHQKLKN